MFHKGGCGSSLFDVKPLGCDPFKRRFWGVSCLIFEISFRCWRCGVQSRRQLEPDVADALVVALVVVVIDAGADLVVEIAR